MHQLDNGLQVVLQENHAAPVVAIQIWVDRGSADDPAEFSGIAHVLEHMVFKGTKTRADGQIAMEIEGAGGQINAWTSFDQTVFHVVLPSRHMKRGLDILADAVQNARFDEADLVREREVILEEIRQGEDSPTKAVSRDLFASSYKVHPYGRPVIGQESSVKRLSKEDLQRVYRQWYRPRNLTLVMVGDFKPAVAINRIRQLFRSELQPSTPRKRRIEPPQSRLQIEVSARETQDTYLSLAFHIPGLMHADTPALDLIAIILGQGDSSRLIQRVKHQKELVSDVYAYSYTPSDPGLLIIGASTPPANLGKAIRAITEQVMLFGNHEVSGEELRRAKIIVESDTVYLKETVQGQARKLGFFHIVGGSVEHEQEYNRRVSETSSARIREVAARYFRPENLTVVVHGPFRKGGAKRAAAETRKVITATYGKQLAARGAKEKVGPRITKVTLKNGARLLVMRDPSIPLVAMRAVWNGGLRFETEKTNGVNSLLAALITRGTNTRSANQINESIESMAGSIGGFSGHNSFGIRTELLARYWEQGIEIMADCLLNPAFHQDEVEKERRRLLDDIRAQEDSLGALALRLFNKTIFTRHPYRLDPLGTVKSMSHLTRSEMVQYYNRHFRPGEMVLAIVGDVDPLQVKAKFTRLFSDLARRTATKYRPPQEPRRQEPADAIQFKNKQQAHIVVGYPGTTLKHKDRFALEVLAAAFSAQGGRLFRELRDRQGLAYQVGAYSMEGVDPGYFAFYIATSPQKIEAVTRGIQVEVERIKTTPITASELKRIKHYLVGNYEISLQRKSTLASLLAFNESYGLGYRAYERYADSLLSVSVGDIQRVAKKYLMDSRRVVVIVRPEELSPGAAKQLGLDKQAGTVKPADSVKKPRKRRSR